LATVRLKEANALLRLGLSDGAYYLAGYAVECALKACIAKGTRRYEFPDKKRVDSSYSHSFRDLIRVAGLEKALGERVAKDPVFEKNWNVVSDWSEQSRYRKNGREPARLLITAIADEQHGVMSWIKLHW
jgi:HEPN domain-containing protein